MAHQKLAFNQVTAGKPNAGLSLVCLCHRKHQSATVPLRSHDCSITLVIALLHLQDHQEIKASHGKELSPDDLILACSLKVHEQQQQQTLGAPVAHLRGLMVLSNDRMLRMKVRRVDTGKLVADMLGRCTVQGLCSDLCLIGSRGCLSPDGCVWRP